MANIKTSAGEIARAKFKRYAKKKRRIPKSSSIKTVSGGLPSLGKRKR
jgi:hypothetical protein